ncbi:TonB-linked outer membrane protein, SusC/RagA family [Chitinophaga jiangningensis]|uniref:TonB-linked outer membrane protein, SusC/RagA family n=1 Tax=Chitinophaga jiangningensis TaxID=1419482 RepID=A0A1M6YXS7_9BACT|nr:SusC/RagA family TonB-linked outer membrane protein [Chitinophaga jiangningensis]SHL22905.1 TonB-linked outer membrane protein, SusC/RagA family [Chitinophaga jiangningensis]
MQHKYKYNGIKLLCGAALLLITVTAAAQSAKDSTGSREQSVTGKKNLTVTGRILDASTGKPAAGVHVSMQDFSAAITDTSGKYRLQVPSYNVTILVDGDGYASRMIPLQGRKKVDVTLMDASHTGYQENIVMPVNIIPQREITSAAQQYNVDGWQQNSAMPDELLQGRIAGLNVTRRSGTPGAGATLFLRGINSIYATNKPLVVVDNMIFDTEDYGESVIANYYTNPLSLIDAKDIDNITVLKDASSIYGTKGANGAIIITTSHTTDKATHIDFGAYGGYIAAPKGLPVMGASDFRSYLSSMMQSKGMSPEELAAQPYMNDDPTAPGYARYHNQTNWQDKVLTDGFSNNYYLKVTGGDNIATYGLSMGYMKNQGTISGTDLSRYNTRFNAQFNFTQRFTGFANLSFTYNQQQLKDQGIADRTSPLFLARTKSPFLQDHEVNDAGVQSPNLADVDLLGTGNPTAVIDKMIGANIFYRFFGSFGFKYDLGKHWNLNTTVGVVLNKVRENMFVPGIGIVKDTLANAIAENRMGSQVKRMFTFYNDTWAEYEQRFNMDHKLYVRAGLRTQTNNAEQDYALGFNSATDDLTSVQNGLPALRVIGGGMGKWNWFNTYLSSNYGFRDKLFLTLNVAMDGSSRFGKAAKDGLTINGSKFPVMPSVGGAWLVSSESFMAHSKIDLLKLRASYSVTGNDDIGNYTARQTYITQNLLGLQGLVRKGIANPELQWETSVKLNGGIDVAILNERLSLSVDAYKSETKNMLVYENVQAATGFEQMLTNAGRMKNTGVDLSLNARIVDNASFKWDLGVNVSKYKNTVIAVPNGAFTTEYAGATILTANGQPANLFYGYKTEGIYATSADAAKAQVYTKQPDGSLRAFTAGDVRFANTNGDNVINADDRTVIGDPNPDYIGGISNRISWKRFELNALITFSQGNDVFNYTRYRMESMTDASNQLQSVNNRWQYEGQQTSMPKATWGDPLGNSRFSDRWIEDGSYLRLRSVSVQYYLPVNRKVIKNATIYLIGNNLVTLTKYKGYDPEFSSSNSPLAQGIDTGLDPISPNVTLGIRIGL